MYLFLFVFHSAPVRVLGHAEAGLSKLQKYIEKLCIPLFNLKSKFSYHLLEAKAIIFGTL